jgi:hypothetical protein
MSEVKTIPTEFLKGYKIVMYCKEEGGRYNYCLVQEDDVEGIMKEWKEKGKLILPVAGAPRAFKLVDIVEAIMVAVLDVSAEHHRVDFLGGEILER